jgi:hypothetical protein
MGRRAALLLIAMGVALSLIGGTALALAYTTSKKASLKLNKTSGVATALTALASNAAGAALTLKTDSTDSTATPLRLDTETASQAPMKVDSETKVDNLNADKLDGKDSSELQGAQAYAHINADGTLDASHSKNINQPFHSGNGTYCVNSPVTPHNVVATLDNSFGEIYTFLGPNGQSACESDTGDLNILVSTASSTGAITDKAFYVAIN